MSNKNEDLNIGSPPLDNSMASSDVGAQGASSENSRVADEISRLSQELQEANDRVLRSQAELENFRKRMRREADEERRYAAMPLIEDLLPVIDNLERAIESGERVNAATELVEGVKMVRDQFLGVLERNHCRRLGQTGEQFDPNLHQAIAQEPTAEFPAGTVSRIARYGYQLHDRVIRPAEVLVATKASAQKGASS